MQLVTDAVVTDLGDPAPTIFIQVVFVLFGSGMARALQEQSRGQEFREQAHLRRGSNQLSFV